MPIVNLNAEFCRKASCPEGKNKIDYRDKIIKGFILEVRSSGNKTYALRFRQGTSQCQYKIGNYGDLTFEKARKAAEQARGKVVLNQDPGEDKRVKRRVPTLSYFVQFHYLPFIKKDKRSWKADESMLRMNILPRFGKVPMDRITTQAIMDFHRDMVSKGFAKGTANRGLILMKYLYNLSIKWSTPGVTSNPAIGVKLFKAEYRERFLANDEIQRLLDATKNSKNKQLYNIVTLLLTTGMRKRELLDSRWKNIDFDNNIWHIPLSKTGSRNIPISNTTKQILMELPRWDDCPYVIPNQDTLKPHVQIHRAWYNARIAAGLPDIKIHDLRHTFASNLVNGGRSIYEVSSLLGHASITMSQRYAHLSQATLLDAANEAAKQVFR